MEKCELIQVGITVLLQCCISPLHPFVTQAGECLGLQEPFREREYDAFFFVEMFARAQHGPQQQVARLFRPPRLLHLGQLGVNFLMLFVEKSRSGRFALGNVPAAP